MLMIRSLIFVVRIDLERLHYRFFHVIPVRLLWVLSPSNRLDPSPSYNAFILCRLFVGLLGLTGAGCGLLVLFVGWAVMPEHHADTAELREQVLAIFQELANVPYPENPTIARIAWPDAGPDAPVLHLILDASRIDLGAWVKAVRPFGTPLERVTTRIG